MADIDYARLSTGTSDFSALRMRGQIYIDKTEQIHQLARCSQKILLTRPRRYGKSLLVSTFESLFKNGLMDFSGLAIEKHWKDTIYPVVKLDFSEIKIFDSFEEFKDLLEDELENDFAQIGFRLDEASTAGVIPQLSAWLQTLPQNSFVLLIDEYDAPCTACLEDMELCRKVRALLGSFYESIARNDDCLRFAFITGITKYDDVGLNGFTDISLDTTYASLVGFTEEEIQHNFAGYLKNAADQLKLPYEEIIIRLHDKYGGYCFDDHAINHVCQPWSILQFLSHPDSEFRNYWITTGGSVANLERYLHSPALMLPAEYGKDHAITRNDLNSLTHGNSFDDLSLLVQTGYLTIKRKEKDSFFVNYPNQEVLSSMGSLYARILLEKRTIQTAVRRQMAQAFFSGDADGFFSSINEVFALIDHDKFPINNEDTFQTFLRIILANLGFEVIPENQDPSNRNVIEWFWRDNHWRAELKFQNKRQSAEALLADACNEIHDKGGAASSVVRAVAVFSEEKHAFVCWQRAN